VAAPAVESPARGPSLPTDGDRLLERHPQFCNPLNLSACGVVRCVRAPRDGAVTCTRINGRAKGTGDAAETGPSATGGDTAHRKEHRHTRGRGAHPIAPTIHRIAPTLPSSPFCVLALPGAGGCTDDALEHAREVGLLGEPREERDLGERHRTGQEEILGLGDARIELPSMGRDAGRGLERATELRLRETRDRGEVTEPHGLAEVLDDVLRDAPELSRE
jgi:hypothetical protein